MALDAAALDPIETSLLRVLSQVAPPDGPHLKTSRVLALVDDRHGFSPEDGFRRLLALCRPWLTSLRLIDFHGNSGARGFEAAEARYTDVRVASRRPRTRSVNPPCRPRRSDTWRARPGRDPAYHAAGGEGASWRCRSRPIRHLRGLSRNRSPSV